MTKRDLDPDLLAKRIIKSTPSLSSEQARKIAEESCRRVDRDTQDQKGKKP